MGSRLQIFPNLAFIAAPFKGILLDAYGVFWGGNHFGLLEGSKEAMEKLVKQGKIVGILSNTTQIAPKEKEKWAAHGLVEGKHYHFITTSGDVAREMLKAGTLPFATPKKKYWLFGAVHPQFSSHHTLFSNTPYVETPHIDEADFIYLSIPHINGEDQINPELFREEVAKLKPAKLPMLCTNPDRFAHEGNPPRPVVRQGCIAAFYKELGGQVVYIGKPAPFSYSTAMQEFVKRQVTQPTEVLMVGDTPETDIRGARQFGMKSALLTKTGMMADRIAHQNLAISLGDFSPYDCPDFYIERLGRIAAVGAV